MKINKKKPKVGIYSPYIDIFGGGEKYILSIADTLSQKYEVDLFTGQNIKKKSAEVFNIFLNRVHFLPNNLLRTQNLFNRYSFLRQYDIFFYLTDGSLFFSGAKRNFLIIQSPLHIPKSNLLNNLKLAHWQIICYSQFMKDIIKQKLGENMKISTLPPCIDLPNSDRAKTGGSKENIILSVGRFFPYPHDKKHDVLIDIFKSCYKKYFRDWKLIVAGGLTEEGGKQIVTRLKSKIRGFPIEIVVNISHAQLAKLYQKAKIYWHATGFGEDLIKHPGKAEHFGIAPLEAMAQGVVPIVFAGGGLQDIITDGQGGYLWSKASELIDKTYQLINDNNLFYKQAVAVKVKAADYSCTKFYEKLEKIIAG